MLRRIILIGIPGLILVFSLIYSRLGGFNDPQISELTISELQFIGKHYQGTYRSNEIEKLFYEVRNNLSDGQFLTIINYPTNDQDTVRYFIGSVALDPGKAWDTLSITNYSRLIRFEFNKHNLVMPKPYKVFEMAQDVASSSELKLNGISIETYKGEREVIIDFLVEP